MGIKQPALGIVGDKLLKPVFDLMAADVDLAEAIELFAIPAMGRLWIDVPLYRSTCLFDRVEFFQAFHCRRFGIGGAHQYE